MYKKNLLKFTAPAMLAVSTGIPSLIADEQKSLPPNIVYILADDMGYGDVGILNKRDNKIKTPNLDQMAKDGMIFTDAHSGSAVCTPTRYGIITGRYAWRTRLKKGVLTGYSPHLIDPKRMTVASFLKKNGYNTAIFGKWHMGLDFKFKNMNKKHTDVDWSAPVKNSPNVNGFDYSYIISASLDMPPYIYIENDKFLGTCKPKKIKIKHARSGNISKGFKHEEVLPNITQRTADYIKKHANDGKPFFIYMPLTAPHTPVVPTKNFHGKTSIGRYGDFCEEVDWCVGQILKAIKDAGIKNNTLVFFTSDNGCAPYIGVKNIEKAGHFPSYIYRGYKSDLFEGGHRVPFIVMWPAKIKAGSISNEPICLTDLLATCANILGKKLPDNAGEDSISILPIMLGKKINQNLRKGIVHHSIFGKFAIREGKWKLLMAPGSGGWTHPPKKKGDKLKRISPNDIQLYNIEEDPSETTNLANKYPEIVSNMKKLLIQYIKNGRSTQGKPQPYNNPKAWPQINFTK